MDRNSKNLLINKFLENLETLIPSYSANPLDAFAKGNVAVCVIDTEGNVFGKIWGDQKVAGSQFFQKCLDQSQSGLDYRDENR